MNAAEIDQFLRPLLEDRKVSAGEKKLVLDWLEKQGTDDAVRHLIRSRAFALVRDQINDGEARILLQWLEDMTRLLARPLASTPPTLPTINNSQAFFSPGMDCITEIIRQFNNARQSCDVCVFTITDDRISRAMIAAHRRGVRVRIITDDEKSLDAGSDIERLDEAGIPTRMDGVPGHMHHKFAIFDRVRLLTGSFNWTRSATEQNEENLIITSDPTLVEAFGKEFEDLWSRLKPR